MALAQNPRSSKSRRGGQRKRGHRSAAPRKYEELSLAGLVGTLRGRSSDGEDQESLIAWLEGAVAPYGIRVRTDERTCAALAGAGGEPSARPASRPTSPAPEAPLGQAPGGTARSAPGASTSPAPEEPAGEAPEGPAGGAPEAPEAPAGEAPEGPVGEAPEAPGESAEEAPEEPAERAEESTGGGQERDRDRRRQRGGKRKAASGGSCEKGPRGQRIPYTIDEGVFHLLLEDGGGAGPAAPRAGAPSDLQPERAPGGPSRPRPPAIGRVILSCDRASVQTDVMICAECNGVVLDAQTWEFLAVPPRAFNPRLKARAIDEFLSEGLYDIIQVSDGTVVTLYQWVHPTVGEVWCLSSGNGYDVSALRWMGPKAYSELLYELLSANLAFVEATGLRLVQGLLAPDDVRLGFDRLDPAYSYTLGFRHPNFHPLPGDPSGVWSIQTVALSTGEVCYGGGAPARRGLPHVRRQAVYDPEALRAQAGAPLSLTRFQELTEGALEEAKAAIARGGEGIRPLGLALADRTLEGGRNDVHVCPLNYGFILRSRDVAATKEHSDILIESPLLKRVRQLVYQRPGRHLRDDLTHETRLEYNALRAYLTVTDRDDFLALHPQFAPKYAKYKEFTENVLHLVLTHHRQNSMAPATRRAEGPVNSPTAAVARALLPHICSNAPNFSVFNQDARSIAHDYIVHPEYALLYLRAMGGGR